MKGKFISTSLILAVLSRPSKTNKTMVAEKTALLTHHHIIWQKHTLGPDELKRLTKKQLSLNAA